MSRLFTDLDALPADFRRLAERLRDSLNAGPAGPPDRKFKEAAVLLPIIDAAGAREVLVFRRPSHMSTHSGQYAFPGGRRDAEDPDVIATALRETQEELGIDPAHVQVLGQLTPILTPTGFRIYPVVGRLPEKIPLTPHAGEVEEVVYVPWSFLADPANRRQQRYDLDYMGLGRGDVYFYDYGPHTIWGATAHMINELLGLMG